MYVISLKRFWSVLDSWKLLNTSIHKNTFYGFGVGQSYILTAMSGYLGSIFECSFSQKYPKVPGVEKNVCRYIHLCCSGEDGMLDFDNPCSTPDLASGFKSPAWGSQRYLRQRNSIKQTQRLDGINLTLYRTLYNQQMTHCRGCNDVSLWYSWQATVHTPPHSSCGI